MNDEQYGQLNAERERLVNEIASLVARLSGARERLAGLDTALNIISGKVTSAVSGDENGRARRGEVKDTVLRIIQDRADEGASAQEVVAIAAAQGIELDRGSVSSLLSKLKSAGTLDIIGNRYRNPKPGPGGSLRAVWSKPAEVA